jgi:drug/metabolite transporter (DMT)-like permease
MNRWTAAGLLFLANALWGTSYVVAKVALEQLPSPLLGALRFTLASTLLWLIILGQRLWGRRQQPRPEARLTPGAAWRLLGLGLIGVAANHLVTNYGQSLTTATDASLMIVGEVIFTTVLGFLILRERPGRWKWIGVAIGGVGAATLILSGAESSDAVTGLMRAGGDLLILLGLPLEALYSIVGTLFSRRYPRLTVAAMVNTGSLLVWLPVLAWYMATGRFPWDAWTAFAGVIYLALINSVICYLIWFRVLESAGSHIGAISLFAQPLVGATLGLTLLGDRMTPGLAVGGCLILTALFFSTRTSPGQVAKEPLSPAG